MLKSKLAQSVLAAAGAVLTGAVSYGLALLDEPASAWFWSKVLETVNGW